MILLEVEGGWKILESVSITLTFLLGMYSLKYIIKEYKRNNDQHEREIQINEMNLYFKIKKQFYSENSIDFTTSILDETIKCITKKDKNNRDIPYLVCENENKTNDDLSLECLDVIEDLCIFNDRNVISIELIYEGFGSIIEICHENPEVKKFIKKIRIVRDDKNGGFYSGLEKLNIKLKEYEKKLNEEKEKV